MSMFRGFMLPAAVAAVFAASATGATVAPALGNYAGRTTADAAGKPRAIAFAVKKSGCGASTYCVAFDSESFLEGKCATTGFMYNAFFPITTPIPLPASGTIDHTYTLYVANGSIQPGPGAGAVPSGKLHLALSFDGGKATGSERVIVDLREGDGVCDTGTVRLAASR
jgi:hypothetical protein